VKSFTSRWFREMYSHFRVTFNRRRGEHTNYSGRTPPHPGLNFKKVDEENKVYSARVGLGYRVLGQIEGSEIVWFWIGSHGDYDKVV
jgi:hypothetical protein